MTIRARRTVTAKRLSGKLPELAGSGTPDSPSDLRGLGRFPPGQATSPGSASDRGPEGPTAGGSLAACDRAGGTSVPDARTLPAAVTLSGEEGHVSSTPCVPDSRTEGTSLPSGEAGHGTTSEKRPESEDVPPASSALFELGAVERAAPRPPSSGASSRLSYLFDAGAALFPWSAEEASFVVGALGYARARGRHQAPGEPATAFPGLLREAERRFAWTPRALAWLSSSLGYARALGQTEAWTEGASLSGAGRGEPAKPARGVAPGGQGGAGGAERPPARCRRTLPLFGGKS